MKNRKGAESVEVWMWIIAGIIIAGLIFGGGFTMLSKWMKNGEVKMAQENFALLVSSSARACARGFMTEEVNRFVYPGIVQNISVKNSSTQERGIGNLLCLKIEGEREFCNEVDMDCQLRMGTIYFDQKKMLFGVIQKALKKAEKSMLDFSIFQEDDEVVCINSDMKYEEADLGVERGEIFDSCQTDCGCAEGLLCDPTKHCCPPNHYFDGTDCLDYATNDACDPIAGENCNNNPDCENECSDAGGVCCPNSLANTVEDSGCILPPYLGFGNEEQCSCNEDCSTSNCAINILDIETTFCCPVDMLFDGTTCIPAKSDVLIFTTSRIASSLGSTLDSYLDALRNDGYIFPQVIKLDDVDEIIECDSSLSPPSVPVPSTDANIIIASCSIHYDAEYVLILGGHNDVMQMDIPCGGCSDPSFTNFKTDDFFVDLNSDGSGPDIPIGRIPTGMNGDVSIIRNYITKTAIPQHNSGSYNFNSRYGYLMGQGGGAAWGGPDSFIANNWGDRCSVLSYCYIVPPSANGGPTWSSNANFLYFLNHGNDAGTQVFTDDTPSYNVQIEPSNSKVRDWSDSVVMLEPCYGGRIHNVNGLTDSIILNMINGGTSGDAASIVLGGTATQWGTDTFDINVCSGDPCTACLYDVFWDNTITYSTFGEAFMDAKETYMSMNGCIISGGFGCNYRIAHQTQFYGDPSIKIR